MKVTFTLFLIIASIGSISLKTHNLVSEINLNQYECAKGTHYVPSDNKQNSVKNLKDNLRKVFLQNKQQNRIYLKSTRMGDMIRNGKENCVKNDGSCAEYNRESGHCLRCEWGHERIKDESQGDYCEAQWWYIISVIVSIIVGIVALVLVTYLVVIFITKENK